MPAERRTRSGWAIGAALALVLGGCTPSPVPTPSPSAPTASASATTPTASPTARPFTVLSTEPPRSFDPASATTGSDAVLALNLFQRLLVVRSGDPVPKPDAADCQFKQPTVYECQLVKGLTFSNGDALSASDVKFSIERAYRLAVAGTSITMFNSLQRVEVVDDLTVRFVLAWPDSQFGLALATPVASVVDEQAYDPDAVRAEGAPIGSGPFTLTDQDAGGVTLTRNPRYVGATKASLPAVRLAVAADSATVEQAMSSGSVDVVWRSLDAAALGRLASGASKTTMTKVDVPDARLQRLAWNPAGTVRLRADVRTAVAVALQGDRTLASLVPPPVAGSVASFPIGGAPTPVPIAGPRLKLTLSYASRAPGQADLARLVRDRLESRAGLSVQLKPDASDADLILSDSGAWVNTTLGWLQPYLDHPLPGSQAKLESLARTARSLPEGGTRDTVLAELQQQAAADTTVLPISLGPETLFVKAGVTVNDPFGPCWHLGLWGFST